MLSTKAYKSLKGQGLATGIKTIPIVQIFGHLYVGKMLTKVFL